MSESCDASRFSAMSSEQSNNDPRVRFEFFGVHMGIALRTPWELGQSRQFRCCG